MLIFVQLGLSFGLLTRTFLLTFNEQEQIYNFFVQLRQLTGVISPVPICKKNTFS